MTHGRVADRRRHLIWETFWIECPSTAEPMRFRNRVGQDFFAALGEGSSALAGLDQLLCPGIPAQQSALSPQLFVTVTLHPVVVASMHAHPSNEGRCRGYSTINRDEYETSFSNRWMELHGDRHLDSMMLCMGTFHHEYDEVWSDLFEQLEKWIEANDAELEATKNDPQPDQ